jgi:hypothetical protein
VSITCELCGKVFEPDAPQSTLIVKSKAKNMPGVMVKCPHCWQHTMVRLQEESQSEPPHLRCPVAGCSGRVVALQDETGSTVFGCGECGSGWSQRQSLQKEIDDILLAFPYRAKSYVKQKGEWIPADSDDEVPDYEELVELEPPDTQTAFDRDQLPP